MQKEACLLCPLIYVELRTTLLGLTTSLEGRELGMEDCWEAHFYVFMSLEQQNTKWKFISRVFGYIKFSISHPTMKNVPFPPNRFRISQRAHLQCSLVNVDGSYHWHSCPFCDIASLAPIILWYPPILLLSKAFSILWDLGIIFRVSSFLSIVLCKRCPRAKLPSSGIAQIERNNCFRFTYSPSVLWD